MTDRERLQAANSPVVAHFPVDRSVQMRLYTMHKREFVVVFMVFFACLCLCLFVGLAGPPITVTVVRSASDLAPHEENATHVNMAVRYQAFTDKLLIFCKDITRRIGWKISVLRRCLLPKYSRVWHCCFLCDHWRVQKGRKRERGGETNFENHVRFPYGTP